MNPLSKETIELIEEKAEHPSVTSSILFIEVAHQVLTDPEILASVKGDEWVNVEDATPTAYHTGNFDGKKSDPVLAEMEFGIYKIGVVYKGYMDGRHFIQWYDENDFEIKTPRRWRDIPL